MIVSSLMNTVRMPPVEVHVTLNQNRTEISEHLAQVTSALHRSLAYVMARH